MEEINFNDKSIQVVKEHSKHKINIIVSYVKLWINVAVNYRYTKTINFIDCMCNSGIYSDGTLCTCTEVLKVFVEYAKNNPNIKFNLFCNDYNSKRIEILDEVFDKYTNYKEC